MIPDEKYTGDLLSKVYQDLNRGGMLSSEDFKSLCYKGNRRDFKNAFEHYYLLNEETKEYKNILFNQRIESVELGTCNNSLLIEKPRLLIEPFHDNNLTPFSYDLSIGNYYASLRSGHLRGIEFRANKKKKYIYEILPRETVIIISEEYICLPPHYSATIWPKFGLVREGIFQSMVKIDPTWRGRIAVALTNISPSKYPIEKGAKFGTLVVYELNHPTSMRLIDEGTTIPKIEATIQKNKWEKTEKKLKEKGIAYEKLEEENDNFIIQLDNYNKTLKEDLDDIDLSIANSVKFKIIEYLNLEDLDDILKKEQKGNRYSLDELVILNKNITPEGLKNKAIECGGACIYMPSILDLSKGKIEEEVIPFVQSKIENELTPKLIQLTFSILGFLALITAILAIFIPSIQNTVKHELPKDALVIVLLIISIIIGIVNVVTIKQIIKTRSDINFDNLKERIERLENKLNSSKTSLNTKTIT